MRGKFSNLPNTSDNISLKSALKNTFTIGAPYNVSLFLPIRVWMQVTL